MRYYHHSARQFADSLRELFPPGLAFKFDGQFADNLLVALSGFLHRIDLVSSSLLDFSVLQHVPKLYGTTILDYRLYLNTVFLDSIDDGHLFIEHLMPSSKIGVRIGSRLWSANRVYYLHVRYKSNVINYAELKLAMDAFKQAHIFCFYEPFL